MTTLILWYNFLSRAPAGMGKGGTYPPENVQARLALITIFWFAQKEPKSLSLDRFHRLKIDLNAFSADVALPDPALPQIP